MSSQVSTPPEESEGPFTQLMNWLGSLPIAIAVMILLAIFSAIGTFIPQEHLAQPPMGQSFEQMLLARYGATRYDVIRFLGLQHIYFTWYYFLLLLWLSVSAVVCNVNRFKRTLKLQQTPPVVRPLPFYEKPKHGAHLAKVGATAAADVTSELSHAGYRMRTVEQDGATYIYGDRGMLKNWSMVLLHFAVLVLLAGGIYGKALGVDGMVALADGENKTLSLDRSEKKHPWVKPLIAKLPPLVYELSQDKFRIDYDRNITLPAGMSGMIPEEQQEYFRYFVKDFVSTLTAKQGSRTVSQEVKVNHPLDINGLYLFQSSYQQNGYFEVEQNGQVRTYPALPDTWTLFTPDKCLIQFNNSFAELLPDGNLAMTSTNPPLEGQAYLAMQVKAGDLYVGGEKKGFIGPLTLLSIEDLVTGQSSRQILSPTEPLDITIGGQPAVLRMSERIDNTSIFSYSRDPGIPVLYLGWIAMIIGITFALYLPFGQVWVRLAGGQAWIAAQGQAARGASPLSLKIRDKLGPQ